MTRARVVCISDTYGQHARLCVPDGDMLIHACDLMAFGDWPKEIVETRRVNTSDRCPNCGMLISVRSH